MNYIEIGDGYLATRQADHPPGTNMVAQRPTLMPDPRISFPLCIAVQCQGGQMSFWVAYIHIQLYMQRFIAAFSSRFPHMTMGSIQITVAAMHSGGF